MSIDKNDPRLTAYALGEMDPAETAAFEAELDDAARAEIEAIRAVAERIPSIAGPIVTLTPEQRWEVLQTKPRRHVWLVPAAAAAAIAAIFFLPARGEPERQRREIERLKLQVGQWKKEAKTQRAKYATLVGKLDNLGDPSDLKALKETIAQLRDDNNRAALATQTEELRSEGLRRRLDAAEHASGKHVVIIEQLTNQMRAQLEINRSYKEWLEKFADGNKAAVQDKLNWQEKWQLEVRNRVRLESELKKAMSENQTASGTVGDLQNRLRNAEFWLNKYRLRHGDMTDGPKGAAGAVMRVKGNLVVLSVGSKDGVRVGDTYQVRRAAKYVGQVTVTTVYKDQAVATFDNKFKGPAAPPQAGDVAEPRGN